MVEARKYQPINPYIHTYIHNLVREREREREREIKTAELAGT